MSSDRPAQPSLAELEEHFRELTQLMYDTDVTIPTLEARAYPRLAPGVIFEDPWLRARGFDRFTTGLRGFHCVIHFDLDIFQIGVQLDPRGDAGRAIVDGVMNLRQLRFYTYPLRTILVYDFVLTEGGLQVTRLEEMWSFADMIANAPLVGRLYDRVLRPAAGHVFTALFALSCALFPRPERATP